MSTCNQPSPRFENIQVITSIVTPEDNNAGTNATTETPASGMFLTPSTVAGRAADVTGFLVVAATEQGKLEFADPDGFLALTDLSDVTITAPTAGQVLSYNGTLWVNATIAPAGADTQVQFNNAGVFGASANLTWSGTVLATTGFTSSGATNLATAGTVGFFGTGPVAQGAAVTPANAQGVGYVLADVQSIADAVNAVILRLQAYGLLA